MCVTSNVSGKIVRFDEGGRAVVAGRFGECYLDIDEPFHRLKVGDDISAEEMKWYLIDGTVISILGERYLLNGMKVVFTEVPS